MAYISFIDLFKHATSNIADDFYYSEGGGTTSTAYPISNAQTRNLGVKYRRTTTSFVDIYFQSNKALLPSDTHLMTTCVGLLGHNLDKGDHIGVSVWYRTGIGSLFKSVSITSDNTDKFNNTFFSIRQRINDVPWKIRVRIARDFPQGPYVDIGRLWVGPMWDVQTPGTTSENLIQEGWKLSMVKGAKSDITIGNQSYSNKAKSFKALDFKMVVTDEDSLIGPKDVSLGKSNSLLAFINEIENGGECIVVPKEFSNSQSPTSQDRAWADRVGIYGESGSNSHTITQESAVQFGLDVKIKEIQ